MMQKIEDFMKMDLHEYVSYFGVSTVLEKLSEVCNEQPHNWRRVRDAINELAEVAKEFEQHYDGRRPEN